MKKWNCEPFYMAPESAIQYLITQNANHNLGFILEMERENLKKLQKSTVGHSVLLHLVIETNNVENIKAVLSIQFNDFSIGRRSTVFEPLIGHGIFASDGPRWKVSREMLKPQFVREQIGHIQMLEPHFQDFAQVVSKQDEPFDIQAVFHKLTFDIATDFLFGESRRTLVSDLDNKEFSEAFNVIQDIMMKRFIYGRFSWLYRHPEYQKSLEIIHESARYYVNIALNLSEKELASQKGYVFLYELVKQTRDPKILQDELLSIMLAGRNTTSALLSFALFELSKNHEVWEELKLEVSRNFGTESNVDDITFESMKRCLMLKNVINETLRMYPPVARNMRVANKNTTLPRGGGTNEQSPIFVPKSCVLILSIHGLHRLEIFGEEPDKFNPDRWNYIKPGSSFLPFGTGPRICLGQQFSLTQMSYILIRIVQTFPYISQNNREYPPKKITNATMRLANGLEIMLSREREKVERANEALSKKSF